MSRTFLTTASGRMVDLLNPKPSDVFFADFAEQLAKEPRYNGATAGVAYSVGQHLCIGTDLVWLVTGDALAAACFLLHDFPEAVLKDDTTPKKRAIEAIAVQNFGVLAGAIVAAYAALTERWDRAIYVAAGLTYPAPAEVEAIVHKFDRVMLAAEWRDFMPHGRAAEAGVDLALAAALPDRITPWEWPYTRFALVERMQRWLPAFGAGGVERAREGA